MTINSVCLLALLPNAAHLRLTIQQHAKAAHAGITPLLIFHLRTIGVDPGKRPLTPKLFDEVASKKNDRGRRIGYLCRKLISRFTNSIW